MRKSPGRVARPISLVMALLLFGATVVALAVGATQSGDQRTVGLQAAFTLAILAVLWVMIGIMFSLPRALPGTATEHRAPDQPQQPAPPAEPPVNWFQDPKAGSSPRSSRRRATGVASRL